MAGFAIRTSFAGHASNSARADNALTFKLDHHMGAGHARVAGLWFPPLAECRADFQDALGQPVNWPYPAEDDLTADDRVLDDETTSERETGC